MLSAKKRILAGVIVVALGVAWSTIRSHRQAKLDDDLVGEVSNGDTQAVTRLLEAGADPSAKVGCEPIQDTLLRLRNFFYREHWINLGQFGTPLSTAAVFSRVDIARLLMDRGASVDMKDGDGRTPLSHAAQSNGNPEAVENPKMIALLLDRGADVNSQDNDGFTPIMWAIFGKQPGNVRLLLARGADPKRKDRDGEDALQFAIKNSYGSGREYESMLRSPRSAQ